MNSEQLQALRDLAEFATEHAREVFGEKEEFEYGTCNGGAILNAARIAIDYLDAA